jgi:hypothetical protein
MIKRCRNKICGDLIPFEAGSFCPSCRYMGRLGMFVGGIIVGVALGIFKWLEK